MWEGLYLKKSILMSSLRTSAAMSNRAVVVGRCRRGQTIQTNTKYCVHGLMSLSTSLVQTQPN